MDALFGVSVAQGALRFTPVQRESETFNIQSLPSSLNVGNARNDCDGEMSEDGVYNHNQASSEWQELWNDNVPTSPGVTQRGSKRFGENDDSKNSKSRKTESFRKGGAAMLVEKLDNMVKIVTERNIKDMELMNIEANTLGDSSNTLADSLAKLVSMPGLIPGSSEFCFACSLSEDPQKRIILNGMPDDYSRLQWIKFLYAKNEKIE